MSLVSRSERNVLVWIFVSNLTPLFDGLFVVGGCLLPDFLLWVIGECVEKGMDR